MRKSGFACHAFYVNMFTLKGKQFQATRTDRPGLVVNVPGHTPLTLAALHASSAGPKTASPQAANIVALARHAARYERKYTLGIDPFVYQKPHVIFGDLNINADSKQQLGMMEKKFSDYSAVLNGMRIHDEYVIRKPDHPTRGTAFLDWALVRQDMTQRVRVLNVDASVETRRNINQFDDDEDWMEDVEPTAKSDHGAIMLHINV